MTILIHFWRFEKSGFFFFLNKRNTSYPCTANVLHICFVSLLGNPHWLELLLGLLLDLGNALSFRLCRMETFK